jgi:hypothetical protein
MIRPTVWRPLAAAVLVVAIFAATGTYSAIRRMTIHRELFAQLRPVALSNCQLERFGEPNDGGYLLCGNLLTGSRSAYSYGIAGYDGWGCGISRRLNVPVHEYDCFDTRQPRCPGGRPVFHPECVAGERTVDDTGRLFDTVASQVAKNGDDRHRLVVKMDVEGAEWEALLHIPDHVLQRIDQLVVEFHHEGEAPLSAIMRRVRLDQPLTPQVWSVDDRAVRLLEHLKRFFHVAHVHVNNFTCTEGVAPFPAWAYEVLFVNKTLGVPGPPQSAGARRDRALEAPNNPGAPDCQIELQ